MASPVHHPARAVVFLLVTGLISVGVSLASVGVALTTIATTRRNQDIADTVSDGFLDALHQGTDKRAAAVREIDPEHTDADSDEPPLESALAAAEELANSEDATALVAGIRAALFDADAVEAEYLALLADATVREGQLTQTRAAAEGARVALEACLSRAEGQERIRLAVLTRPFLVVGGAEPTAQDVRGLIASHRATQEVHGLVAEVYELSLLQERLRFVANIDDLARMRDNLFLPALDRLVRLGEAVEARAMGSSAAIAALGRFLFGERMRIDHDHQTIVESPDGLFSLEWAVLSDATNEEGLLVRHAELLANVRTLGRYLDEQVDLGARLLSERNHAALRRTWQLMVVVLVASIGAFLTFGVRVTRSTRRQFRAIQTSHESLTANQAALSAANESLSANQRALAGANDELLRAGVDREALHQQLVVASRQAGMAEVATGVLHNVGNVLNSVNVAATVVAEKLRHSEVVSLAKAGAMIRAHREDLAEFLSADVRGKHLPEFLIQVAECLSGEQAAMLVELEAVTRGIDHVKYVVSMQQAHAKKPSLVDTVRPADVMETALELQRDLLKRDRIVVERRIEPLAAQSMNQHVVIQILVNLVANARQAMAESAEKRLTVTVGAVSVEGGPGVCFEVTDTGKGIAPENLVRIFSHGFTTRQDGHGFGLHSAANAAGAMGGSLTPLSDGPGRGATFRLVLPAAPARRVAEIDEPVVSGPAA